MEVNSVTVNLEKELKNYLPINEFLKMKMNPSELIQKKVSLFDDE